MSFRRKAGKLVRASAALLKNPALLNEVLDQEDLHKRIVQDQFGMSDGLPEIPFEYFMGDDEVEIKPFAFLSGGSLPTDLALLKLIALKIKASSYFEIGMWRGESVANVSSVVPQCFSLNLSAAQMEERNWEKEYIRMHGYFCRNLPGVTLLEGDSRTFDFTAWKGKQDLVFIDGDHHYDSVVSDTRTAFSLLKDRHSAIVWHDYGDSPESVRWNILHAILQGTPAELRNNLYTVSNTLSAVYLPVAPASRKRVYPQEPAPFFSVTIKKSGA